MRRFNNLSLIGRGFFFLALMAALAFTVVRGEAERRPLDDSPAVLIDTDAVESVRQAATSSEIRGQQPASRPESAVEVPFQISADGQLQRWATGSWTAVAGLPSRATSLAVVNQSVLYVGTEALGVFKSVDAGDTWIEANNADLGLVPGSVLDVTALTVDPEDAGHVFAATAFFFGSTQVHRVPAGVYASTDGGETWRALTEAHLPGIVTELKLDPNRPGVLVAHWEASGEMPLGVAVGK